MTLANLILDQVLDQLNLGRTCSAQTPMLNDVMAIQVIYGASTDDPDTFRIDVARRAAKLAMAPDLDLGWSVPQ